MEKSDFLRYDPTKLLSSENRFSRKKAALLFRDYEAKMGGNLFEVARADLVKLGIDREELKEQIAFEEELFVESVNELKYVAEKFTRKVNMEVSSIGRRSFAKLIGLKDKEIKEHEGLGRAIAYSRGFED